jgi:hypothetical protein
MAMGQVPVDFGALTLRIMKWAACVPLAILAIFASGCAGFLGGYFLLRSAQWVYWNYLSRPWR